MVVSEAVESGGWGRVRSSARRRAWAVGELRMRRRVWHRAVAMESKPVRLVGGLVGGKGGVGRGRTVELGLLRRRRRGEAAGCERGDGGRGGLRGATA